jgi:MFS family permease
MLSFAITAELSERSEYTNNISMMEVGNGIGLMAGPLLVSIVYESIGYTLTYLIVLVLSLICLILVREFFIKNKAINKIEIEEENYHDDTYSDLKYSKSENNEVNFGNIYKMHTFEKRIRTKSLLSDQNLNLRDNYENIFIEIGSISNLKHEEYASIGSFRNTKMKSFISTFFNKKILFTVLIVITDMICQTFFYPMFTYHFKREFGLNVSQSSFLFSLSFLVYTAGLRLVIFVIRKTSTKYTLCLAVFFNSISVLFFAPAEFLPRNIVTPCIGLTLLNLTAGFGCVGSIFEFSDTLEHELNHSEEDADDRASGLYIITANIGELIGPLMGGYFTTMVDIRFTCYLVGFINVMVSIFYFTFNFRKIFQSLQKSENLVREKITTDKNMLMNQENLNNVVNSGYSSD